MAWEYPTNYSNGSIVGGPGDFFLDYPSAIVPQFGNGILILVFLVSFIVAYVAGIKKALVGSCFITSIIATFFAAGGWVNPVVPIGLGAVTVILIIISIFEGPSGGI